MAPGDRLSLLAVVTIFVVVIGTMHVGVEYSRGGLLDREPATELESDLRGTIWERLDAARVDRGAGPAQREPGVRATAQETARELQATDYFAAETAVGPRDGNGSVPNDMSLCHQVPAKYTVGAGDWSPGGDVSESTLRRVADRAADLLVREDVLAVPNDHRHGVGVAVGGDTVYVVYRYCNLGY